MTAYEVYKEYVALKQHFTSDYDYFKYGGKSSVKVKSFEARKDRIFFEKLAKHHDPKGVLLANVVKNPKVWIRDISYSDKGVYEDWAKRLQSMSYTFKQELNQLDDDFNENFVVRDGQHPKLLRLYLSNRISVETLSILSHMTNCLDYWDRGLNDPIWQEVGKLVRKYVPFLVQRCDVNKMRELAVNDFRERGINTNEATPQHTKTH